MYLNPINHARVIIDQTHMRNYIADSRAGVTLAYGIVAVYRYYGVGIEVRRAHMKGVALRASESKRSQLQCG
jgi:hypothetical protein